MRKVISALLIATVLLSIPGVVSVQALGNAPSPLAGGYFNYPTFVIKAVDRNTSVTIQTDNLPANDNFVVTMGAMGTRGVNGIVITTIPSGTGGRITKTFSIPAALYGSHQIAIRLESKTSGYYAYNWFYNYDANLSLLGTPEPTVVPSATPSPGGYSGYPTFSIQSVVKGTSVTIAGNNFPPNDSFEVRMNWMWTRGIAGAIVTTVTTDGDGNLSSSTFDIPDFLVNTGRIAIRLQSPSTGYYAYNWFYNNDAP